MRRAPKACSYVGPRGETCPLTQPCPEHQRKPWADHKGRHGRMRSGSKEQKVNRAVMFHHEGVCHVCGQHGSDEVDHVIPLSEGGSDGYENRRPIHSVPCHREKTAREAARARNP